MPFILDHGVDFGFVTKFSLVSFPERKIIMIGVPELDGGEALTKHNISFRGIT